MSEPIIVRVTLGSYDIVHPSEKQTQVYVQIPEVARASWLLPEDHFHFSKNEPWPNVVDSAQECYRQRGTVTDSASAAARAAVVEWLQDDANHDAMQAAWFMEEARRHPVSRKLLEENERLRWQYAETVATVTRLEQKRVELERIANAERARVAELEARLAEDTRPANEGPIAYALTEQAPHVHSSHTSWQVEVLDGGRVWLGTGIRADNREAAEDVLTRERNAQPDVQFRLVRATTTYALEPAAEDPLSTPELHGRLAQLLDTIRTHRGEWRASRVQDLRRLTGGPTQRGIARRDLADLHRMGHLLQHGPEDGRFYTLNTRKDRRS